MPNTIWYTRAAFPSGPNRTLAPPPLAVYYGPNQNRNKCQLIGFVHFRQPQPLGYSPTPEQSIQAAEQARCQWGFAVVRTPTTLSSVLDHPHACSDPDTEPLIFDYRFAKQTEAFAAILDAHHLEVP